MSNDSRPRRGASSRSRTRRTRKKGWRALVAPLAALIAVVGVCLLGAWFLTPEAALTASPGSAQTRQLPAERTAALPPLKLPDDEGLHRSAMEWWYYSGILDAKTGGRYAFHMAVFVADALVKHTVMHVALTDLQTGKRYVGQTRTGGVPAQGAAHGFDFSQDRWQAAASGASHVLRASFDGFSIALDLADSGQVVPHRAAGSATPGLLDFGQSGISYYYSRPRISARGELSVGPTRVPVTGNVWFDHQWGDFDVLSLGWNWFALHLADGSDVMLYELFDAQGRRFMTAGTVANANGFLPLEPGAVELTPLKTWTSPRTAIGYPVEWKVKLPSGELIVKPFFADAEFDSRETTANVYWEGPVKVTGSITGEGFLELSGYDRLSMSRPNGK